MKSPNETSLIIHGFPKPINQLVIQATHQLSILKHIWHIPIYECSRDQTGTLEHKHSDSKWHVWEPSLPSGTMDNFVLPDGILV